MPTKLPPTTTKVEGDTTVITEYKESEDGKIIKITRKIQKKLVKTTKTIQERRNWTKFGDCRGKAPGPDSNSTTIGEAVYLKLSSNAKDLEEEEEDPLKTAIQSGNSKIVCRICKGDHWTTKCPFKDTHQPLNEIKATKSAESEKTGKYVPPSKRGGAQPSTPSAEGKRDDSLTVRISNLSVDTTEYDVRDLIASIGPVARVFVARDHQLGVCKGYAFITFMDRSSCERCIQKLDGYGYDSLILKVEFASK